MKLPPREVNVLFRNMKSTFFKVCPPSCFRDFYGTTEREFIYGITLLDNKAKKIHTTTLNPMVLLELDKTKTNNVKLLNFYTNNTYNM